MSSSQTPTPSPGPAPTPGQRPTPRPYPHRTPSPGGASSNARAASTIPSAPVSDPSNWGRIDTDGNAFVTTPSGERLVGVWQAGTAAEGLAHYGARFDDVATEVVYLKTRLDTHPSEAAHLKAKAAQLRDSLDEAAIIGDIEGLKTQLNHVIDNADTAALRAKEEKQARQAAAIAKKEALAAEAEELAESSTEWKAAGDRIRAILEEWKKIRGIDRKTDDELWKRYSRARDAFNRRRGAHFAELDRGRASARRTKEELLAKAEELKTPTEWNETARAFRDLMDKWRHAGRAQREVDEKLWQAFKAAQDHFFNARHAETNKRNEEFEANAIAKEELLQRYDSLINPTTNLEAARKHLSELQEKWEAIGYVPKNRVQEFEQRIRALEARVSDAANAQWRRTDPEALARAEQFTAKVEEFRKAAETAAAKGKTKEAEKLRAQAQQWQEWADAAMQAVESR